MTSVVVNEADYDMQQCGFALTARIVLQKPTKGKRAWAA
jgi:hypothetical protein